MADTHKHYQDPQNLELYAYAADGSEDAYIKPGLNKLTVAQLAKVREDQAAANALPLPEQISVRRYEAEVAGIRVGGAQVDTGRDSQALITGAALAAVIDPAYVCNWKTAEGFVELNATALIGIASAIRAHVQACFDREAELLAEFVAGTYKPSMLNEGWPA